MDTYQRSARVYDLLAGHKDYRGAADDLTQLIVGIKPDASTLLDVACGTGGHLQHLRHRFTVEGLDLSQPMLDLAGSKCPGVPLHLGTLAEFHLGRRFDAITCLFGSIAYCAGLPGLRTALAGMAAHLNPGGVIVIEPWITAEKFQAGKLVFDSADFPDMKVARMYVSERLGDRSVLDATFLVATPGGVETFSERHELWLFSDDEYRAAITGAGLDLVEIPGQLFGYGMYVAYKH